MNCVRVIKPRPGTPLGAVSLWEDSPKEEPAEIRCALGYWGELADGREKRYRSPWVAVKSERLRVIASRCIDYETDD